MSESARRYQIPKHLKEDIFRKSIIRCIIRWHPGFRQTTCELYTEQSQSTVH